jgi:myosin heavy subunit
MLIRISLIIAIIAALAAGTLNFITVKEKIETVIVQRDDWKQKWNTTDGELTKTKTEWDKTKKDLAQTQEELATTKSERDNAVSTASAAVKKAEEVTAALEETKRKLSDTAAELAAYVATGLKPQEIASLDKQIKNLQTSLTESIVVNKGLQKELDKVNTELDKILGKIEHIILPASLEGRVLVADPKWDFVVLNVGDNDAVKKDGELLVNRNGRLVAKVRVTEVQSDRSIANVLPGWSAGDVMEGDQVIAAYIKK